MPSAASDTSALFSTIHGRVDRSPDRSYHVTLGDREWTFAEDTVRTLHDAIQPLAAQVYRCNCECRWQVRVSERQTVVLSTDEVLRLHSLLDGTIAMMDLYTMLDDESISPPATE